VAALWGAAPASAGDPLGQVTEFTGNLTPNNGPNRITLGPDGNLWFTERDADRIGRITPSGTIKEFHTGITPGAGLWGITAGPDGRLWFTESQFNTIGAITTTGTVTEYSPPELTTPALGITPGPDGNLWFAQNTQVGRITTAGAVQQFTSGFTTGGNPNGMFGIATGSDGNLWAMEGNLDKIARITTAGTVQEFSSGITSGSGPQEGTAGPDGNLWFTEVTGNRIGRAAVAPTGTTGVLARDFAFTPKTRKTPPGSKVKWMFEGPNPHSVADTTGLNSFHTGSHSFVTYFSKTFNSAGTFTYHCTLHPTLMKGVIVVRP
jgi:streptogramin lyase